MSTTKKQKTLDDTKKFVEMVAKKQNWYLHPDKKFFEMLIEGLTTNYNRFGYYGCPCRLVEGKLEQDKDVICPCIYCEADQKDYGHCYCGLYSTPEFHRTKKKPQGIPERRPVSKWI